MEFIKKGELSLKNGGYLSNKKGSPVSNVEFVKAQEQAHYIVKLAEAVKGKDFKGKIADNFLDTVNEVVTSINKEAIVQYNIKVDAPEMKLRDQLAEEALAWMNFDQQSTLADKVNSAMQQFNVIRDFEDFGLFFSESIVKLNKIYTINEILEAVKIVEPHLNN